MHMTPGHAYITLVSPKTYIIRRKQPVGPENIPNSPMCSYFRHMEKVWVSNIKMYVCIVLVMVEQVL